MGLLAKNKSVSLEEIEESTGLGKDSIFWAVESLSKAGAVSVKKEGAKLVQVSEEGKRYKKEFPEEALIGRLKAAKKEKISSIKDQIALGWAKRNNWVKMQEGSVSLTDEGTKALGKEYQQRALLSELDSMEGMDVNDILEKNKEVATALMKRNLISIKQKTTIREVAITKLGSDLVSKIPKDLGIGALTKDLIKGSEWKTKPFRPYDINAPTEASYPARPHPVREFINVIRQKWFEMGFIEVEGPIIESAFWNFDALFSPQDHPTRDMQDTFFLSNPKQLTIEDIELMNNVREMHLAGWKESWSEELARSAVLRTHTTSVSARYMKKLAKAMESTFPTRMFSIGSVFRNESIDYKHIAELRQYDGIIVGDNLTLANLIYTLKSFYSKLGLDDVRMRPSYFPFTEPSIEFFYYDNERDTTVELCGGGIIRKEITKAMGLNKTVLAWGGGVDRLLLNQKIFGVESLPLLYKNDIAWLRARGNIKV